MTFGFVAHVIDHWSGFATIGAMLQQLEVALTVARQCDRAAAGQRLRSFTFPNPTPESGPTTFDVRSWLLTPAEY